MASVASWLNAVFVLGNFLASSYFFSKIYTRALIQESYFTPSLNLCVSCNGSTHMHDTWSALC